MRRAICAVIVLVAISQLSAASGFGKAGRGTTSAEFLTLSNSARAAAMGEAIGASADDSTALQSNPAALTRVTRNSVSLMHAAYIESTSFDDVSLAHNFGRLGAVALGAKYFSAGNLSQTDVNGFETGSFRPHDAAYSLGYAYRFANNSWLDGYSLGVAGKYVDSQIVKTARTFTSDVGLLSRAYSRHDFRMFAAASNVGGKLKFDEIHERLPLDFRTGASLQLTHRWLAETDVEFARGDNTAYAVGSEYALVQSEAWNISFRAGLNTRTLDEVSGFTGASFGLGIGYKGLRFDYAFVPFGTIDLTHQVSIGWNF